jgi:ankyrin repeat protein
MVTGFTSQFGNHRHWFLLVILLRIAAGFFNDPTPLLLPIQPRHGFQRVAIFGSEVTLFAFDNSDLDGGGFPMSSALAIDEMTVDRRPYEQRTKGKRSARRMNHGFRYLYRTTSHLHENVTAFEYLNQFYSETEVIEMNRTFPPLLDLNVSRHVHPKIRFLKETMMLDDANDSSETKPIHNSDDDHLVMNLSKFEIPAQYFGARLEKTIAPSHAFLVHMGLPNKMSLLVENKNRYKAGPRRRGGASTRWHEFLLSCRKTKQFCALCNQWQREKEQNEKEQTSEDTRTPTRQITSKQIEAFQFIFSRGLMAAARDELVQANNTWPLQHINITSREVLQLLIEHGANPLERDNRGTTLLHWSAGTGNLEAFQTLLPYFPDRLLVKTDRDGATPLHWACAGANSKEFGTGGHYHLCQHILSGCENEMALSAKELVNQQTKDGNSPLMWAAWSSSLDTVKLMVRYRARWDLSNRNGCTVAHWAASGGNLEVCKYLAEVVGVDFFVPNHGGNTPLTHAVAFGRLDVVQWLRERAATLEEDRDDLIAKQLVS